MDVEQRGEPEACIRDLLARTKGPVRVQLSSEVGVEFPVEVFDERGPGYVGSGTLGLSRELAHGLVLWHRWWEDHVDWCGSEETAGTDEEWREWSEEGDRLLERLRQQLGPAFQVQRV